jgi:hypothetical protein
MRIIFSKGAMAWKLSHRAVPTMTPSEAHAMAEHSTLGDRMHPARTPFGIPCLSTGQHFHEDRIGAQMTVIIFRGSRKPLRVKWTSPSRLF